MNKADTGMNSDKQGTPRGNEAATQQDTLTTPRTCCPPDEHTRKNMPLFQAATPPFFLFIHVILFFFSYVVATDGEMTLGSSTPATVPCSIDYCDNT